MPRQVKFVGEDSLFYDYSEITRKYKIGAYVLCGDLPKIFRYDLKTPKERERVFKIKSSKTANLYQVSR